MTGKWLLPVLALLGLAVAAATVVEDSRSPPAAGRGSVERPPYASFVAGTGVIEASSGNIAIGTPVPGVVSGIAVKVGEHVKGGDPLFRIDDRALQAQLVSADAQGKVADAELQQARHRLDYAVDLRRRNPGAESRQHVTELRDAMGVAQAKRELAVTEIQRVQTDIARTVVRAPRAGQILRLSLRKGEYLGGGAPAPIVLFGEDRTLYLRVDVDQSQASRIRPGARAVAFVRGDPRIRIPLHFEYIEPEVVAKTSLTGLSTERTDTRVLQVIYSFARGALPVYVGQQMDVFIDAGPNHRARPS